MDIEDRLVVSDQEWADYAAVQLAEFQDSQTSDGIDATHLPSYQPTYDFIESGELAPLLSAAEKDGFAVDWRVVAKTNPGREQDAYINNIQNYWAWLLDDKETRIPNQHMLKKPVEQSYFWRHMLPFSSRNDGLQDPKICQTLFASIFGEEFTPEISYRIHKARPQWSAEWTMAAEDLFDLIMNQLHIYLFYPPMEKIGHAKALIALEYWFSIIPHIRESYFARNRNLSTKIEIEAYYNGELDDQAGELVREKQWTRKFFALLNGYDARFDKDENMQNDPEVCHYIRQRLDQIDLPDEYHRFMEFIHTHKEDCMNASS